LQNTCTVPMGKSPHIRHAPNPRKARSIESLANLSPKWVQSPGPMRPQCDCRIRQRQLVKACRMRLDSSRGSAGLSAKKPGQTKAEC
jgi:hypothetical protein